MSEDETIWQSTVRWAECDAAGIIYHARVFDWFSEARIQWLRDHKLDYYQVLRPEGLELLVKRTSASFHHTLHPGDPVTLHVTLSELSPTRTTFGYTVAAPAKSGVIAVVGFTEHAFVVEGKARRLDRTYPEIYERFQQYV